MAGTSYTRQSTFADGDVVEAALFNNEYNQLLSAFSYASSGTTGHQHDGGAGEGGNIEIIGDQDFLNKIVVDSTNNRWGVFVEVSSSAVEQIRIQDGAIVPVTDNDIDLGTSSLEFKDAYFDGTVTTDALVADTADINGGSVDGATIGAASASTIVGTTITANTAFVPDASDGAALGTSSLEFSDLFLADGAVINLGADQDTTLTHVADTGILLNSTRQLQFGDSGTYIHQSADGVLDLVSDTEIEINATTIDINGAVDVSGEIAAASLDISGNVDIDGTTNLDAVDIDGTVQIDGATTFGVDDTGVDVKFFGDTASAYLLWDTSADKLLTAGGAVVDIVKDKLLIGGTAVTTTAAELNILDGKSFVDEDDMSSNSATAIASQQSIKAYVDNNAGMSNWILEDDDGTEVTISNAKEVKFIGSGVTTNWTDTDNGTDGDPYDLTFTIDAAQTGITSLLATDIKIGEDDQTKIDFETADEIHFYAANVEQVYVADNIFGPQSDSDVDLGSTSVRWKDAFVDSITVTGEIDGDSLDIEGNADINGTTNLDAVDIDGAVQIDATVTVGVDDTGYDVKFFGATSGKYMEWDESADQLDVTGSLDVTGDATVTATATGSVPTGALIQTADANSPLTVWNDSNSGTYAAIKLETRTSNASGWMIANEWQSNYNGDLLFRGRNAGSTSAEVMRLKSGGSVGIGESSPLGTLHVKTADSGATVDASADELVVEGSGNAGITILSGATNTGNIYFGDSGTNWDGYVAYSQNDRKMTLGVAAAGNTITLDTDGATLTKGALALKNGATSAGKIEFYEDSDNGTNKVTLIGPAATADVTLTLPSSDGDSGQFLQTDGSGVMSWAAAGGAYSDWSIITSATNPLVVKGQYISNSSSALTHTLPSGSAGDSITICNAGSGLVTIARTSSQKINSVDADGTLPEGNSVQLVYVDSNIGWFEI